MRNMDKSRIVASLLVALAIFVIAIVIPKLVISGAVTRLMTTQGLELGLSLAVIAILGKSKWAEYGFCLPKYGNRWLLVAVWAPLLGAAATLGVVGFGGSGSPVVKSLTFPQMILFVWIFSSIIEEVFTRGFLQSHLSPFSGKYIKLPVGRVEWPVLVSALFFGLMHLVLLFSGADITTVIVTVLFTFSLGLMAGYLRSTTGSLIPAIVTHLLGNIGGLFGGIIYAVFCMLTGRPLPGM